jgi:hypothetical protein
MTAPLFILYSLGETKAEEMILGTLKQSENWLEG